MGTLSTAGVLSPQDPFLKVISDETNVLTRDSPDQSTAVGGGKGGSSGSQGMVRRRLARLVLAPCGVSRWRCGAPQGCKAAVTHTAHLQRGRSQFSSARYSPVLQTEQCDNTKRKGGRGMGALLVHAPLP